MKLKAILFDLDGVVAETEDLHRQAYNWVFEELGMGVRWSFEDYKNRLHMSAGTKLGDVPLEDQGSPEAVRSRIYSLKRERYLDLLKCSPLEPRPGVVRLVEEAVHAGVRLAAASTCAREGASAVLRRTLGALSEAFEVLKAGDDARSRKPDPEIYLLALDGLGLPPDVCVAIEDTRHGLAAARAAGLATVVTPSEYTIGDSFEGALRVAPDLDVGGVTVECLNQWLTEGVGAGADASRPG